MVCKMSEGLKMITNHDHIVILSMLIGSLPGFLIGYAKGHEHGKIQGKINARRLIKAQTQHQVNR